MVLTKRTDRQNGGFGHRFLLNRTVRLVLPIEPLASGLWVSEKDMQQD